MHEGADSMATLSVQVSVTVSLLRQRDHPQAQTKSLRKHQSFNRGSQLKLNSDNKVNTNVFASISFQKNDKVFSKVEETGGCEILRMNGKRSQPHGF